MPRAHGLTANTPSQIILDSGAVYLDYGLGTEALLGATRGGAVFNLNQTIRDIPVDGARGPVQGLTRRVETAPMISCTLVDFGTARLKTAIVGSTSAVVGSWDVITRDRDIILADYVTNAALVAQVQNKNNWVIIVLSNVLIKTNFTLTLVDKDEGTLPITLSAHFTPTDLDTDPVEVRWPLS